MRRKINVLLSAALVTTALVGCGGETANTNSNGAANASTEQSVGEQTAGEQNAASQDAAGQEDNVVNVSSTSEAAEIKIWHDGDEAIM